MRNIILFLSLMFVAFAVYADTFKVVDSVYLEKTSEETTKFTKDDIEKNLKTAQDNLALWQGEVARWQSLKDKAIEIGVADNKLDEVVGP